MASVTEASLVLDLNCKKCFSQFFRGTKFSTRKMLSNQQLGRCMFSLRCEIVDVSLPCDGLQVVIELDRMFIFPLYFPAYCFSTLFPRFKRFFKTRISHLSSDDEFVGESTLLRKTRDVLPSYCLPYLTTFVCDYFTHILCWVGNYSKFF